MLLKNDDGFRGPIATHADSARIYKKCSIASYRKMSTLFNGKLEDGSLRFVVNGRIYDERIYATECFW
jgi:hypothetical protein